MTLKKKTRCADGAVTSVDIARRLEDQLVLGGKLESLVSLSRLTSPAGRVFWSIRVRALLKQALPYVKSQLLRIGPVHWLNAQRVRRRGK